MRNSEKFAKSCRDTARRLEAALGNGTFTGASFSKAHFTKSALRTRAVQVEQAQKEIDAGNALLEQATGLPYGGKPA